MGDQDTTNKPELIMNNQSTIGNSISWIFAIIAFAIGLVNSFWGNDLGFGIFILLLSFVFFPPVTGVFRKRTGISIPIIVKILVAIFIIWASLGVGELFDKIELMMKDL